MEYIRIRFLLEILVVMVMSLWWFIQVLFLIVDQNFVSGLIFRLDVGANLTRVAHTVYYDKLK